nr:LTA synthase family protein [Curvibacter sp. CHRR-16]
MGYQSAQEAAKVLGLPADSDAAVQAALYQHPALPAGAAKKNLIFFLMESWSAEPMLYQSPRFDVLGRMVPTLKDACHFDNFDSAQPGTHPSLEAILFSSPITPLTLGDAGRKPLPSSIAVAAQKAGYHTLFLTSGRSGWRDLNRVLHTQGFDEVIDANNLRALYPEANVGLWGVWDEYIFKYLQQRLAQPPKPGDKPLMVFVLSVTNHPPYDLPENYTPPKLDMSQWKGETSADTLVPNLDTYRYAADLLGGFVQWLRASPWWDNTIMAGTGDHNVRSFGVYAEASRRYLIRQVPFVIWGKNLQCGTQQHLPASHRDMFPTLFPLLGVDAGYVQSGRNLLAQPSASPMDAPRTLFYTAEARNAQGAWQLGNPGSFVCTSSKQAGDVPGCVFNPQDDAQERARIGLLDWNIRYGLQQRK